MGLRYFSPVIIERWKIDRDVRERTYLFIHKINTLIGSGKFQ